MIRVGDRVAFNRKDAKISNHACGAFGIDYFNCLEFKDCKFYKGVITKIKTHQWFFFKLDNPIYIIDDFYMTCTVKPVKRKYASLREVFNSGEKLESVWELHIN